mmetsp:Transcript_67950/g.196816  ORF Transcript_67950/g.196816 Transcript_67950/m.196816 type:complete len:257 (-) Transcript_67950:723-1493(-)
MAARPRLSLGATRGQERGARRRCTTALTATSTARAAEAGTGRTAASCEPDARAPSGVRPPHSGRTRRPSIAPSAARWHAPAPHLATRRTVFQFVDSTYPCSEAWDRRPPLVEVGETPSEGRAGRPGTPPRSLRPGSGEGHFKRQVSCSPGSLSQRPATRRCRRMCSIALWRRWRGSCRQTTAERYCFAACPLASTRSTAVVLELDGRALKSSFASPRRMVRHRWSRWRATSATPRTAPCAVPMPRRRARRRSRAAP